MVDFNEIVQNINTGINNFVAKTKAYFESLTQFELYAWIAIGVGFVMVLISLITW